MSAIVFKFREEDKEKIWAEIRWRLISARENSEMTQEDVARTKIVTQSTLSKIESGIQKVDIITLAELAAFYDEDLDHFIPKDLLELNYRLNK